MLKLKLLLEKQENMMNQKQAEEKRNKEENENLENKRNSLLLNNEFKTQNTEVPTDGQINDLTKYNFQKNSTNLQMMGFNLNINDVRKEVFNKSKTNKVAISINFNKDKDEILKANKIKVFENSDAEINEKNDLLNNLIGNFLILIFKFFFK
jgi:hypothetical protein